MKLTFGQLVVGELFTVEESPFIFEKTSVRKRSGRRPFATNAKVFGYQHNSVKSGWFLDNTEVIKHIPNIPTDDSKFTA